MPSILMIPRIAYPFQHAMLETVYTRLLPEKGYRVVWLTLSAEVTEPTVATWNGTEVHLLPLRSGSGRLGALRSSLRLLRYVVRLVRRERFDFLQVRNAALAGLLACALARGTTTRFVYQFSFPVAERLMLLARTEPARVRWAKMLLGRALVAVRNGLVRRADLVLAISDEMRAQLIAGGVPAGRVLSFPLGTESPPEPEPGRVAALRARLGLGDDPVVLYFGTIAPERQLDFLVRVAGRVRRRHPSCRWVFVGRSTGGEAERLAALACSAGLADRFVFTGGVPRAEVPAYLRLSALSVSPIPPIPLFWLSSPTKAVEALAMGCPVVATEVPDQANLITASGGGVVAPFEEEAFAAAVCSLLDDPGRAARMGHAGKTYVRAHRSYVQLADLVDGRYRQMLAS